MGLSKIVRRTENKISRGATVANKIVTKGGSVLNTASNVLGKVGNAAEKAGNIGDKILSNPIVEGIVAANPELMPLYGGAIAASKMVGEGGKLADRGSVLAAKGAGIAGQASNKLQQVSQGGVSAAGAVRQASNVLERVSRPPVQSNIAFA